MFFSFKAECNENVMQVCVCVKGHSRTTAQYYKLIQTHMNKTPSTYPSPANTITSLRTSILPSSSSHTKRMKIKESTRMQFIMLLVVGCCCCYFCWCPIIMVFHTCHDMGCHKLLWIPCMYIYFIFALQTTTYSWKTTSYFSHVYWYAFYFCHLSKKRMLSLFFFCSLFKWYKVFFCSVKGRVCVCVLFVQFFLVWENVWPDKNWVKVIIYSGNQKQRTG